ncbi:unnamed protein product [Phytomonas sp. Hart1]|nr:unnamed protein product [Phytomonas sp. Hart1]|eukprot:CCW70460.1 unnamed protein product [Phytomonas sp. isolate Hart1]
MNPSKIFYLYSDRLNPTKQVYSMEHAFEEPTFRFICGGVDIDFKANVFNELLKIIPKQRSNFVHDALPNFKRSAHQTLQLFRGLCSRNLVSFAQVRSTPQRLLSLYETVAMVDPALALVLADHFTFFGLVASHADTKLQRVLLEGADSGRIVGCIAQRELSADEPPFNTEARYDAYEKCFYIRGTGKFAVVAAEFADWAIVSATLTLHKSDNQGTYLFLVPLREGGHLCKCISVSPIASENDTLNSSGSAIIHFDEVRIEPNYLLHPFTITKDGRISYVEGKRTDTSVLDLLQMRTRLATGAIYVGLLKRLLTDVVHFVSQKDVVGPDFRRNYPYFGIQHVQRPLVSFVAKSYVYFVGWQQILSSFTNVSSILPRYEDHMKLAGTIHFLQELVTDLNIFALKFLGIHSILSSSIFDSAFAVVQLRKERLDSTTLIREVAFKSVTKNIGTTHWGWWLTSFLQSLPSLDRFVKNPFYSPRNAELGRHYIFFSHKHYASKRRLRLSREIERRRGGSEHQWYDWVMFQHREVVHCGEAFMEMYFMDCIMNETQNCTDPRGRKLLRDVGWIYALTRQMDRLDFILSKKMLSEAKAVALFSHIDNLVTVLAPQCVNMVDAFQFPRPFRSPYGWDDMESYWTIPGTNVHIQRGDKVALHQPKYEEGGSTKSEQETAKEEEANFDLFHGLTDHPSYSKKPF